MLFRLTRSKRQQLNLFRLGRKNGLCSSQRSALLIMAQQRFLALYNGTNFVPALYDRSKAPIISSTTGFITSPPGTYDPYNGLALPGGSSFAAHTQGLVPASILNNPAVTALFKNQPQGFTKQQRYQNQQIKWLEKKAKDLGLTITLAPASVAR
jgi:hypothetical protein